MKYPIGQFSFEGPVNQAQRLTWIEDIAQAPSLLRASVNELDDAQLDTPYREGGWTVRQVVHHVADSHVNSYIRFHWTLTEDTPTIKAYDQDRWALLPDAKQAAPDLSLDLLTAIHKRWVYLLNHMIEADFKKSFVHPETNTSFSLDKSLALYVWHGKHHTAQITELRKRRGWS